MAKFVFKSNSGTGADNVDVYSGDGVDYAYESFSTTQIKLYDNASNYTLVSGYGFSRDAQGEVTAGTITSLVNVVDGLKIISITGLSITVSTFLSNANDPEGLIKLLMAGNDQISLTQFDDSFHGGGGNDRILGGAGDDTLFGNSSNDRVFGHSGADKLYGGTGNDYLRGGSGRDKLYGGTGADRFSYALASEGNDLISGFDGKDVFEFEGSAFRLGSFSGTLKLGNFRSNGASNRALDSNDYFVFNRADDTLWFDSDGRGSKAPVMIADLTNNFNLSHLDIQIV